MPPGEVWLRPDEAASLLRTTVATTHAMASQHQWRRRKQGRTVWYLLDDVIDKRGGRRVG